MDYKFATIEGWSMLPLLRKGDIIAYKCKRPEIGSIILFNYNGIVLAHRLISDDISIVTKGDNTPYWDKEINSKDIIGVAEFALRGTRTIYLNKPSLNKLSLVYAKIEMKIITIIKKIFYLESNRINGIIKNLLFPFYALIYIHYINNSSKRTKT